MVLTSLEIKDKTFGTRMRGYDREEVDDFLDIVVRDYEDLVKTNHDMAAKIKMLEERIEYFDEIKESLSQSVIIAQDTAERVKQAASNQSDTIIHQAEQDAHHILEDAKFRANELLRQATDNAKKVAVETEELKNKTRIFHQRLKSTIESQLAIVDSSDWEEILRPTATYLQTSDDAFREVVGGVLGEEAVAAVDEPEVEMTRQFSPEEMAELQRRIDEANRELLETQAYENLSQEVSAAIKDASQTDEPSLEGDQLDPNLAEKTADAGKVSVDIL